MERDNHDSEVIMRAMAFQITGISIVYSAVFFKRRSKKTTTFRVTGLCEGIHRWPMDSPHKGPVPRIFPHLITSSWWHDWYGSLTNLSHWSIWIPVVEVYRRSWDCFIYTNLTYIIWKATFLLKRVHGIRRNNGIWLRAKWNIFCGQKLV